ncbi:hypothetical protein WP50_28540 [Lactiplantibacillus plantarum]|nr:hypothetical protein WP50_28540 [Lactiplantibacillus plantarum]
MGLFSFGKKVKLYAPVDGTLIDLATVAAGQTGFAVTPERHHIFSPVTGTNFFGGGCGRDTVLRGCAGE